MQAGICQRGSRIVKPAGGRIWRCGSSSNVCRRTVIYGIFQPFLSDMVRVFSRWQGISLELKIKKKLKRAFIFTLWSSTIAAAGIGLAGFPFCTDDHELLLKEDMAAQIGIFTFRSQCLILPLIPIGILSNMLFQGIGQQGEGGISVGVPSGKCISSVDFPSAGMDRAGGSGDCAGIVRWADCNHQYSICVLLFPKKSEKKKEQKTDQ